MNVLEIIWSVAGLVTIFAAIKIAVKFNLNRYLEYRNKRVKERLNKKLMWLCPHFDFSSVTEKGTEIQPMFQTFRGTFKWQCQMCGLIVQDEQNVKLITEKLRRHTPQELLEKFDKFMKYKNKIYHKL